jgi:hypothetical protein
VRRVLPILATLALLAGCGSSGGGAAPPACLAPTADYLQALESAPAEVRLSGSTAISDCFTGTEDPGIGQTVIEAATKLNAKARRHPGGPHTVSLGYLAGAVHEGAEQAAGADADLVRRLDVAARFSPGGGTLGGAFERAFGKGYAAGQEGG